MGGWAEQDIGAAIFVRLKSKSAVKGKLHGGMRNAGGGGEMCLLPAPLSCIHSE
jgi:hypothetical protein